MSEFKFEFQEDTEGAAVPTLVWVLPVGGELPSFSDILEARDAMAADEYIHPKRLDLSALRGARILDMEITL